MFKRKLKPDPNYYVKAWGTTVLGDIQESSKTFFAKSEEKAKRIAKKFAVKKEMEIFVKFPNYSIYTDGSYPNSIGIAYSWKKLKNIH